MKRIGIGLFIVVLMWVNVGYAQEKRAFYLSSELEVGNYIGLGLDLNYIYKDKYSFSIGIQEQLSRPSNFPKDYDSSDDLPFTGLKSIGARRFLVGRIFYFDSKRLTRLNLQIGVSSNIVEKPTNWERREQTSEGYRYSYRNDKNRSVGFVISPSIEFPLFNVVGFKVAPKVHFTKGEVFVGLGLGILLGDLK